VFARSDSSEPAELASGKEQAQRSCAVQARAEGANNQLRCKRKHAEGVHGIDWNRWNVKPRVTEGRCGV